MPDRRGSRFILEVLFLVGLAVALALAKLRPLEIAGVMLLGWLIVAILEWAAWRSEPHYGSGLPPRYYVPSVNLPPAQPLEQVREGDRESQRDEAATWIASPALRAGVLGGEALQAEVPGEWPHTVPRPAEPGDVDEDPWTIVALPAAPLEEPEPVAAVEPKPAPELVPEPVAAVESKPPPELVPEPAVELAPSRAVPGLARYNLDPLADPPPRRRFGRGAPKEQLAIEISARPEGERALPRRSARQD